MAITATQRTDIVKATVAMFGAAPGGYMTELTALFEANGSNITAFMTALANTTAFTNQAAYANFKTNAEKAVSMAAAYGLTDTTTAGSAGKQAYDYFLSELNGGKNIGAIFAAANSFLSTTTDTAFDTAKNTLNNKTTVAEYYTVTMAGTSTTISTLQSTISGVTATTNVSDPAAIINNTSAGTTGQTYALTTGVDTFTGTTGNDTFNATVTSTSATLGGLDSIDGGAGTDTANIADSATDTKAAFALPTGMTIKNVETLKVTTNGSIGDATGTAFDVSGMTGLTSFVGTAAGDATKGTNVKAANTTDVSLTATTTSKVVVLGGKAVSVTNGAAASTITGEALTTVTVKNSAGMTIDNTDTAANGSTSAVGTTMTTVILDGVDSDTAIKGKAITNLTLKNATASTNTVTITNATTAHTLNLNVDGSGYDSTGAAQAQTINDAVAKTVAITATGAKSNIVVSTGAGNTAFTTATIAGSAQLAVNFDSTNNTALTSIDGSSATGALTLTNTAVATSIKTGSGNDTFTFTVTGSNKGTIDAGAGNDNVTLSGTLVAGSTVNLGDGDDHLIGTSAPATSTTATSSIDAGAGTDTVSAAMLNAGNASMFKNFEGISLNSTTGLDVALLTGSTLTGLYIDAASTTATYQNVTQSMGLNVSYVGDNSAVTNTLSMTGVTGTADSYTITFAAAAATSAATSADVKAGTVAAAGIENFNIVSGGTNHWNSLVLGADTSAQKVTVTGASNLDLTFATNFGSTTAPATGVSLIDASAATGKVSINLANVVAATAGLTVKGGTGVDTITTSTGATTLTGGAGNDSFVVTNAIAASTTAPTMTTITDLAKGDTITFADKGAEVFTNTKVDVSTATALFGGTVNALDLASTADATTNAAIKWFQYAGNTYIIEDNTASTTAFGTSDVIVKISGLVDLSTATNVGNVLTIA